MEIILAIVVIAVIAGLLYKSFAPKLDKNNDGKVDQAEVKAAVEEVKTKAKAAVKKTTTRKPRTPKK